MRTPKEAFDEEQRLKALRNKIPHYTTYGDNNRKAVDAQIEVIVKNISENDIYSLSNEPGEGDDPDKWPVHARDSALIAREWMDGGSEVPSKGWEPLIQSTPQLPAKTPKKSSPTPVKPVKTPVKTSAKKKR